MKSRRKSSIKIKNELTFGLIVVLFFSSLTSYVLIRTTFRNSFDNLVEINDIEIAESYAEALGNYYSSAGSWSDVGSHIMGLGMMPENNQTGDRDRSVERKHPKNSDLALILTDDNGKILYSGVRLKDLTGKNEMPDQYSIDCGAAVMVDESIVGYVLFKSMIAKSYNPQEEEFIVSITKSTGISVLIGIILALLIGTVLARWFARPVTELDSAVQTITGGDMAVRVNEERNDEIGSLAGNFNLMADRLQGAEKSRQTLLADIAHELRTPVSVIQANLEMILDGVYTADEARLKSLYEETKILTALISDLRSISDLDSDINGLQMEKISLSMHLKETCRALQPLFNDKNIEIKIIESCGEAYIMADPDKIRQVLRNILGNAFKYAPEHSIVTVSLDIIMNEDSVKKIAKLAISDEGSGVPENDTEKIFDRFYRVDYSRNRESGGRGLGLAISKKIINSFNGEIGAFNNKTHGLTVWIELPV